MTEAMQEFRPDPASLRLGEMKCFKWYIKALLTLVFRIVTQPALHEER